MRKQKGARLGQHFLTARWAARAVARAAGVESGITVLEIGPGTGNLTYELLTLGVKVVAVEKDSALVLKLKDRFVSEIASGSLIIIENDIRNASPKSLGLIAGEYVVAANIPYYITGEIIRTFLESKEQPKRMTLLVQKEVAERIARSKKESILSLSVKAYGTPRYVKTVSRSCFSPAPRVDSAILSIENISRDFFIDVSEEKFFKIVKAGFASKRKMLAGNLSKIIPRDHIESVFNSCSISIRVRAEDVSLPKWNCLSQKF